MKKSLLALGVLLLSLTASAQTYWQQEVNYTISVRLDDKHHMLYGQESFDYINHSPETLDYLYIHLWPNAYRNGKTALAKQQYNSGEDLLVYGPDSIKGVIDSLDFTVNGTKVALEYDPKNPDIAKLMLPVPLRSGDHVTVATPFRVKIPSGEISRLGHVGQSYQITQWYPKPAVFDKNGWNPIPYLNQGEFYSEYGAYDVSITLPKNYVVGATGDLQTESETAFLDALAAKTKADLENYTPQKKDRKTDEFPASSDEWKTIRYKQSKVHDFAWFADKRYLVLKGEVEMPASKRKVTSWAMFTPRNKGLWKDAIEYINDGTYYYSKWNGDYPYNNVTAVDGTISAGGGMEYPNVTVIGNSSSASELEIVIVHEVGHNWFYGILGSNERVHGWMDEGMNTLNELRYVYTKYPENTNLSDQVLHGRFHFEELDHYDMADFTYRLVAGIGEDQPIETSSKDFTTLNYGAIMYMKTGLVFNYLKQYLGEEEFDKCMHAYFETWKFRHPQPEDMRAVLEATSGKNLDWLFHDLIQTTNHIDYKLKSVKSDASGTVVEVKNVGQVDGPIEVGAYQDGKLVETAWVEPGQKQSGVTFHTEADEVRINPSGRTPEIFRDNDNWHKSGLFGKVEPPKVELLIGDNEQGQSNIFWTPIIAGNQYDKFMLGVAIHNYGVPMNRLQYLLAPMYSFGGNRVSGIADISYSFLPKTGLKISRFGIAVKSFKQTDTLARKNDGYYLTISPSWFAKIGNRKAASPISQTILVQTMYRLDVNGPSQTEQVGGFVKYDFNFRRPDHQVNVGLRTDFLSNAVNGDQLGRSSIEATYRFRYLRNEKSRWMELRGYAGTNWLFDFAHTANSVNYCLNLSGANGGQDIFTEDYYLGRTATSGFLSQQRLENMGGFKSTSNYGTNSQWVASGNFYSQLPFGPSIFGVFADAGIFPSPLHNDAVKSAFDAGLGMRLGKVFGLYFPLYISKDMNQSYGTMNYTARIRMTLRLSITNKGFDIKSLIK